MSDRGRARHRVTEVVHGIPALDGWVLDRSERTVTLVVDANLAEAPITARVREGVAWAGRNLDLVVRGVPADQGAVIELAGRLGGAEAVVAVGGGSLLDAVKLAALICAEPTLRKRLALRHRSGAVRCLPPWCRRFRWRPCPPRWGPAASSPVPPAWGLREASG